MPELPEVETVRDGVARHVVGRTITATEVFRASAARRQPGGPAELTARLVGRQVTAAVRRGKFLWLVLDDAEADAEALLVHLGMSGQLLVRSEPVDHPHLRARMHLTGGAPHGTDASVLDFVDQRTFGHLTVVDLLPTADGAPGGLGSDVPLVPGPVTHIGRDLLDPHLDRGALERRVRARRSAIKRVVLDQTVVSGVGNIYADEALWRARVHHARPASGLRPGDVVRVLDAAATVMAEALAAGGTSFDALYVDVDGTSGYFERSLAVYGRAGLPCPRCEALVVREPFMNRSSFRCPRCQRPPRTAGRAGPRTRSL